MIIKCFRCGKDIDTPDSSNADYVIASDTIVREPTEVLVALKHNQATLKKEVKINEKDKGGLPLYPSLKIEESEYDAIEVANVKEAITQFGEDLVKVKAEVREKDIQKTGIVCPDCYRDTDRVIWGVHKEKVA